MKFLLCYSSLLCSLLTLSVAKPEAFEVSESLFSELPGGKEADGIVGDFILRNDLVEAVMYDTPEKPIQIEGPQAGEFLDKVFSRKISTMNVAEAFRWTSKRPG